MKKDPKSDCLMVYDLRSRNGRFVLAAAGLHGGCRHSRSRLDMVRKTVGELQYTYSMRAARSKTKQNNQIFFVCQALGKAVCNNPHPEKSLMLEQENHHETTETRSVSDFKPYLPFPTLYLRSRIYPIDPLKVIRTLRAEV